MEWNCKLASSNWFVYLLSFRSNNSNLRFLSNEAFSVGRIEPFSRRSFISNYLGLLRGAQSVQVDDELELIPSVELVILRFMDVFQQFQTTLHHKIQITTFRFLNEMFPLIYGRKCCILLYTRQWKLLPNNLYDLFPTYWVEWSMELNKYILNYNDEIIWIISHQTHICAFEIPNFFHICIDI